MDHHPRLDAQSQGKGRRVRKLSAGDNQLAEMWRPDKSLYQPRGDDTAADKRSAVGICVVFVGLVWVTSLSILGVRKRQC